MQSCATQEQLEGFLQDRLSGPECDSVTAHIESCRVCQERLDQITNDSGLGEPSRSRTVKDDRLARLLERVTARGPRPLPLHQDSEVPGKGNGPTAEHVAPRDHGNKQVAASSLPPESLPSIAGFQIIRHIGRGGMGIVYQARDEKLDGLVGIKTLREGVRAMPEQLERLRAEARAVQGVRSGKRF